VTAFWEANNRRKCGRPTLLRASRTTGSGHTSVYMLTALLRGAVCVHNAGVHMIPIGTIRYRTTLRTHAYLQSLGLRSTQVSANVQMTQNTRALCARTTEDLWQKVHRCLHYSRHLQFLRTALCRATWCRVQCEHLNTSRVRILWICCALSEQASVVTQGDCLSGKPT